MSNRLFWSFLVSLALGAIAAVVVMIQGAPAASSIVAMHAPPAAMPPLGPELTVRPITTASLSRDADVDTRPTAAASSPKAVDDVSTAIAAPALAVGVAPDARAAQVSGAVSFTQRESMPLDDAWRFLREDLPGGFYPTVDDQAWTTVSLPHTWNASDGQDGPVPGGRGYYRGGAWYRRHVQVPESWRGRSLFLVFDGACLASECWVNGKSIGIHKGGFAGFAFDASHTMVVGGDNLVAVRVTNAIDKDLAPLYGDFTIDGGLYRNVRLVATSPQHISLSDLGSSGVRLSQGHVDSTRADVAITVTLANDRPATVTTAVIAEALDEAGHVAATVRGELDLPAAGAAAWTGSLVFTKPHLWNGRPDPFMYRVRVRLSCAAREVDAVEQPLGLRSIHIDPDQGFMLNGRHLDLHGVSLHQDRFNKGWASSAADQEEDVALISEMGATAVRLVHYQHPQRTYDLLDRAGILAWSEVPFVTMATDSPAFAAGCRQQLQELIRQCGNHPSVICWGMFNQVGALEHQQRIISDLSALAHVEDPTRPTTGASTVGDLSPTNFITDVIAFNHYFGWFLPNYDLYGPWADAFHKRNPSVAVGISEYGAGGSVNQHEESPRQPLLTFDRRFHSEEYQALYHEVVWKQLQSRPFLWCKFAWTMFDYATDMRTDGEMPGRCDMGLVTINRKIRKDAFYWYQANWSAAPMLHIAGRRICTSRPRTIDVKVYANLDRVGLTVNGVPLPEATSTDHIFRWSGVELKQGGNQVVASGARDGVVLTDHVTWMGE